MPEYLDTKRALHEAFWRGDGPSLMLIPPAQQDLYDVRDYAARFHDPPAMWESEIGRAEPVRDWPTDGVPTARPNLGVIFLPAMAGLSYQLPRRAAQDGGTVHRQRRGVNGQRARRFGARETGAAP